MKLKHKTQHCRSWVHSSGQRKCQPDSTWSIGQTLCVFGLKRSSISLPWESTEYKSIFHTVPRDSLLSLSGRTCTCCWILLHSSVGFNHMICFCFLSSCRHGNLVYSCPQQQVKHRTPKQKGEFPIPTKQERFTSTVFHHTRKNGMP